MTPSTQTCPPSIDEILNEILIQSVQSQSGTNLLERLLQFQSEGRKNDSAISIESILDWSNRQSKAEAQLTQDDVLSLICNEVSIRESKGERVTLEEFQARFPELAKPLVIQWEINRLLSLQGSIEQRGSETIATAWQVSKDADTLPESINRYHILSEIGRGAVGIVYLAWDTQLKRKVAMKRLRAGLDADGELFTRIRFEAEAIARIRHIGIIQIYEVVEIDQIFYLVVEYCEGGSLAQRIGGKPMPPEDAAKLVLKIAQAMHAVHVANIIHRDLKPANVLLESDSQWEPKLTDFGLAKLLDRDSQATATGTILGTPAYMAPEQAWGDTRRVARTADIYSIGAILYECLTGSPPFRGVTLADTLDQVRTRDPVAIRQLAPLVPIDLETIAMKCMRKLPHERYATSEGLAEDIERFLSGRIIRATPISRFSQAWRWCQRNPRVAVLLASVLGLLCLALFILVDSNRRIRNESDAKSNALTQRTEALLAKNEALLIAAKNERLARKRFFAAEMNLAQQAFARGESARVLEFLERQRPGPDQEDLRSFEWHFLYNRIHPGLRTTIQLPKQLHVIELLFAPNQRRIAVSGGRKDAGQVTIWNVDTGALERTLIDTDRPLGGIAFAPDGRRLCAAVDSSHIGVFDVESGELITRQSIPRPVRRVAWSADGKLIAAGCENGHVWLWDTTAFDCVSKLDTQSGAIFTLLFSPASDELYVGTGLIDSEIQTSVFEVSEKSAKLRSTIRGMRVHNVSDEGESLLAIRWGELFILDRSTEQPRWTETVSTGSLSSATFLDNPNRVLRGGNSDRTAEIWDVAKKGCVAKFAHRSPITSVAVDSARKLWASGSEDGVVHVWNVLPNAEATLDSELVKKDTKIWRMAFAEPGELLLGGNIPLESFREPAVSEAMSPVRFFHDASRDGQVLLAITPTDQSDEPHLADHPAPGSPETVEIWDRGAQEPRMRMKLPDKEQRAWRAIDLSPNGKLIATRQWDGPVRIWDCSKSNFELVHSFDARCMNLRFSNDNRYLATCCDGNLIRVFDVINKRESLQFVVEDSLSKWAITVAFSPDGKYIAGGNGSGVVRVVDAATGREISTLSGHLGEIHDLAFFPDGKTLAVGGVGPISFWDFETGQELLSFPVSDYKIEQVVVPESGDQVFARSDMGNIRAWRVSPSQMTRP